MPTSCWWFTQHRAAEIYFPGPPPISADMTHTTHVCPHRFTLTSSCHPERPTLLCPDAPADGGGAQALRHALITRHGRCGARVTKSPPEGLSAGWHWCLHPSYLWVSLAQSSECKATSVLFMGHTPTATFSPRTNQGDETGTENKRSKIKV